MEKLDLRVIKTHKTIQTAFIDLLNEQDYDKIAVQDIIELAMVNRTTFYKYYRGKSDLAGKMIAQFKNDLQAVLQARLQAVDLVKFIATGTNELYKQRTLLLALWKIHTPRHQLWLEMFQMIKANFNKLAEQKNILSNDYQADLFATMILHSLRYQFEQNQPFSGIEMLAEVEKILKIVGE